MLVVSAAQRKVAHLSFDASDVASVTPGIETLLQDLVEHAVMKRAPLPRGEWPGNGAVSDG